MLLEPIHLIHKTALLVAVVLLSSASVARTPEVIYQSHCAACHNTGAANAPKKEDAAAWTTRLAERGKDGLYNSAIKGLKAMPPKGLCMQCSDEDLKSTVDYLIKQ